MFELKILGCGSATPSLSHYPSCLIVSYRENLMMIDCGEGAQLQMRRYKAKYSRLSHIFISHLHGDHVLGLPGLLSTLALHGKTGTVTVHISPEGIDILKPVVDFFCRERPYELIWDPIPVSGGIILENSAISVEAFRLYHRVPTIGFIFREKPHLRHIKADECKFWNVPSCFYNRLREGEDFTTEDGRIIENSRLTSDPDPARSYAYCSDTKFDTRVADAVKGTDVIYHEATYLSDNADLAKERYHSTAAEAAEIARLAGAKLLLVGHYSKRYLGTEDHRLEASAIFPDTIAVDEGMVIDIENLCVRKS